MNDILTCRLMPADTAVDSRVGDEAVILNLESGTYFGLDPLGTRIWEQIKEGLVANDICAVIAEEFGVPIEMVNGDARAFLLDMVSHGILIEV